MNLFRLLIEFFIFSLVHGAIPDLQFTFPPDGGSEIIEEFCFETISALKFGWFYRNFINGSSKTYDRWVDSEQLVLNTMCKIGMSMVFRQA